MLQTALKDYLFPANDQQIDSLIELYGDELLGYNEEYKMTGLQIKLLRRD